MVGWDMEGEIEGIMGERGNGEYGGAWVGEGGGEK